MGIDDIVDKAKDFAGDAVDLEGFITPHPDDPGQFLLTRLVITHCVIDAQPAAVPVSDANWDAGIAVGELALRRSSLDEVFLALTGHRARPEDGAPEAGSGEEEFEQTGSRS